MLDTSQQSIPGHRLHRRAETFLEPEQLPSLHRAEALRMLLEQRHDAPAYLSPRGFVHAWSSQACVWQWQMARHIEQTLVLLLAFMQHGRQAGDMVMIGAFPFLVGPLAFVGSLELFT